MADITTPVNDPNEVIVARTFLHSAYVHDTGRGEDAVVVSEIIENDKGVIRPNLRVFPSPTVSFWTTQERLRSHKDKKEFESVKNLDEHRVKYKDRDVEIFKALSADGRAPNFMSFKMRRELQQSPYLYGGNITIEALVALKYKKDLAKLNKTPHIPTTGFFDIEKSLIPGSYGKLPLMVFTAENQVFLAMKSSFMYEESGDKMVRVEVADVERAAHEIIDPLVESIFAEKKKDLKDYKSRLPFKYHFFVGETEVDMINWIVGKMHETKVSFIGIWNLGFDIPEIIKVLEDSGIPLEKVFADPSLRNTGFAYTNFKEDKRKVHHFTQKWHWLTATAHFQFVDSMALYSYIRMVDGKEASYALDDILKKFGLGGKLKIDKTKELEGLQTEDWHRAMLGRFFTYYALYAMWDGMALQILEWLNNDLTAMMLLGDITPAKFFPNQTIRVTNTLYRDWLPDGQLGKQYGGHILGTGVDVEGMNDEDLLTAGGAVLVPQNLVPNGMKLFSDWPNHKTNCYAWENDFDFSAQYPSNTMVLNISKQTKVSTMLGITAPWVQTRYRKDRAIEVLCSYLITPSSNGVELGTEFFDLPGYSEMKGLFEEHLAQTN
jgi:hypothetical protein